MLMWGAAAGLIIWFAAAFAGAFGIFASDGAFAAGGTLMTVVPLLVAAVWVTCASGYMIREHLLDVTRPTTVVPQS